MKIEQTPEGYRDALTREVQHLLKAWEHDLSLANVTYSQFHVLLVIHHVPNLGMADLAKATAMDRATLVKVLRSLKRRDYLLVNLDRLGRHRYELTSAGLKKMGNAIGRTTAQTSKPSV